jgi:exodeoxyribonuclease V alpha subunit
MLKKDILYTAVTRASKSLSLIGEPEAFIHSVQSQQNLRNTALKERLQSSDNGFTVEKEEPISVEETDTNEGKDEMSEAFILTPELVESFAIDPMIGMENVKP